VILLLLFIREQVLGVIALILLGCATAVTAYFPGFGGILYVTLFSSIGFHYFETVNQSLQLQWVDRKRAPQLLGWLVAVGSGASLVAYGVIVAAWDVLGLDYNKVYLASGGLTALIALFCLFAYPQFEAPHPQNKTMVLRRRYWLYYALQLMAGARRQIFVVFAAFMMVEHFGFEVHQVTALFLINFVANMIIGPFVGRWLARYGERRMFMVEHLGVALVFMAYGGIYSFGWGAAIGAVLYVIDHLFFAMAFSLKTYFQKIGDPADMAPPWAIFGFNRPKRCLVWPL
jgi:Sugar-tranasporters, 12 TM